MEDAGDLHAELKRMLGMDCIGYMKPAGEVVAQDEEREPLPPEPEEYEMGRVS